LYTALGKSLTDNPYAAPSAAVVDAANAADTIRVYSPIQVACGTIGGPVGLIYFLRANFLALGNYRLARTTLVSGLVLIPALLISVVLLPENFPNYPFTIAYILAALYVSAKYQMTKRAIVESAAHDFQSNWRVLWLGLLCLVGSIILLVVPLGILAFFGVWDMGP
jgi:hypothetical protein